MASAEEWDRGASVQRRAQILYAHYHPAMLGYRSIHIEEYCMTLKHLGQNSALPTSPEEAVLDYVGNPRPGRPYLVRFTAPEFTSLCPVTGQPDFAHLVIRSEEHTSELQSLMRISYAVFCLKKQKNTTPHH